jgi:protein TonB
MDAMPDFGVSLSGGGPGGVAVPTGGVAARPVTAPAAAKVLARPAGKRDPGDEGAEPATKPKLLMRPHAAYTDAARAAGVSGKVRVEITVDEQGRVVAVRVVQGLGYGLDESAAAAARALTFEPALRGGKPVKATFTIGFNFSPS